MNRLLLATFFVLAIGAVTWSSRPVWPVHAALDDTTRASLADPAAQAAGDSDSPAMSADGRYIAFASVANSLDSAATDTNGLANIYRRDLQTGDTLLIDRIAASNTAASGGASGSPTISSDGNCVAFVSSHTGIVAGSVASFNVYVRDVAAGTTILANRATGAAGAPSTNPAFEPQISANCSHVVFNCNSCNALTPGTNGSLNNEVYIRQLATPFATERVSLKDGMGDISAATPNSTSGQPTVSADGRYVAFASQATDIEAGVTAPGQIYLRDRNTSSTKAVSRNTAGTVGTDAQHNNPMISADGRFITWDTDSEIVVPNTAFVDQNYAFTVQAATGASGSTTPTASGPTSGTCFNTIQCFLYLNTVSTPNAGTYACVAGCTGAGGLTTDTGITINSQTGHAWIFGTPSLAPGVLPAAYNITISADDGVGPVANVNYTVNIVAPPAIVPAISPGMGTSFTYTQGQDGSFVVNGYPSNVIITCGTAAAPTNAASGGGTCGGQLPTGVTTSPTGSCGSGCNVQISGVPTAAPGLYNVTFRARLRNSNTVVRNLTGASANGMAAGETRRVNLANGGSTPSGSISSHPSITADGRMVAFMSPANDLVTGVGNGLLSHVYLRDIQASTTEVVDLADGTTTLANDNSATWTNSSTGGDPTPFNHGAPTLISSDYRYVTFASDATNLVSGDSNATRDVFRRQRLADAPTTATFTVSKDFIPDSPGTPVTIHVVCGGGAVPGADQPAVEGTPAMFNITNVPGGGTTCTATETVVPGGYTANQTGCANVAVNPGGTPACTITNTLATTATFTVNKDFVPNSASSVTVHVTCSGGTTVPADQPATEAAPAVFNLTTVPAGGTTCAATEIGTPAGYTKNEAGCAAVAIAAGGTGSCTITNTLVTTLTVQKDFVPDSATPVTITVTCTNGATVAGTLPAAEGAPAVFQVQNVPVGGTACTATEAAPAGYTANQTNCAAINLLPGDTKTCTIVNLSTTAGQLTVQKTFVPSSGGSVTISVTCSGGATVAGSLPASEAAPAQFTVNNIPGGGTTCQATEAVPAGYNANQASCAAVLVSAGATSTCTITNTALPNTGTFTVNKDFVPNSAASVNIHLVCTGATVGADQPATEAAPAVFSVTGIPGGGTACTATETPVPAGYTANQAPCASVALAQGGAASCTITNTLTPTTGTFTVNKDFVPDSPASVTITLSCTGGASVTGTMSASEAAPAVFSVTGIPGGGTTCTATEAVPAGYTANQAACAGVALASGGTASCTITNTFTPITPPTVTTTSPATAITTTSATLSGNVTSIGGGPLSARGIVLAQNSVNPNPQIGGTGVTVLTDGASTIGIFSESATGLLPGTNYAFVAYATNAGGTSYGSVVIFTTATQPAPVAAGPKQAVPAPTQQPPQITKKFNGSNNATVPAVGSTATLTFTITNPNSTALTGVGFVDTMPAGSGLTVVPGSTVGSCDAGIILLTSTTVTLAGAVLPAASSCSFSVTVTAATLGSWTNQVTANANGTGFGPAGAATINVGPTKQPKSG